jgi:hypothetical protein
MCSSRFSWLLLVGRCLGYQGARRAEPSLISGLLITSVRCSGSSTVWPSAKRKPNSHPGNVGAETRQVACRRRRAGLSSDQGSWPDVFHVAAGSGASGAQDNLATARYAVLHRFRFSGAIRLARRIASVASRRKASHGPVPVLLFCPAPRTVPGLSGRSSLPKQPR